MQVSKDNPLLPAMSEPQTEPPQVTTGQLPHTSKATATGTRRRPLLGTSADNPLVILSQDPPEAKRPLHGRKELHDPDYKPPPHVRVESEEAPRRTARPQKKKKWHEWVTASHSSSS
jgi:hypothetical protein